MTKKRLIVVGVIVAAAAIVGLSALATRGGGKNNATTITSTSSGKAINVTSNKSLPAGIAVQNLGFSGAVIGKLTQGRQGDGFNCMPSAIGPIVGSVGGSDYSVMFRLVGATGAGTFRDVYISAGPVGSYNVFYSAVDTIVTINPDKRSGQVSADLTNVNDDAQTLHLRGEWACPPDG